MWECNTSRNKQKKKWRKFFICWFESSIEDKIWYEKKSVNLVKLSLTNEKELNTENSIYLIDWESSQMHQLDQMMLHEAVMLEIYRQALSAR